MTIEDLEQLAARHLRDHGEDHPTTLASRNILASALCSKGLFDDAVVLRRRIVATHLRRHGPKHPITQREAQKLEETKRDAAHNNGATDEDDEDTS